METLFVGNLSYFCTEAVLRSVFSPYGTVISAIIRKTKANQTLFYGFVQMKTAQEAEEAVSQQNGSLIQGRRMKVSISKGSSEKDSVDEAFIQTRVSFLTHHTRQQINETLLQRIFARFGEVADCVVKQYEISHHPRAKQCGYAYVYFHDLSSAKRAISGLRGDRREEIEAIRFDCKLSLESAQKLQDILSLDESPSCSATATMTYQTITASNLKPLKSVVRPLCLAAPVNTDDTNMNMDKEMQMLEEDQRLTCTSRYSDVSSLSSPTTLPANNTINNNSEDCVPEHNTHFQQQQQMQYHLHYVAHVSANNNNNTNGNSTKNTNGNPSPQQVRISMPQIAPSSLPIAMPLPPLPPHFSTPNYNNHINNFNYNYHNANSSSANTNNSVHINGSTFPPPLPFPMMMLPATTNTISSNHYNMANIDYNNYSGNNYHNNNYNNGNNTTMMVPQPPQMQMQHMMPYPPHNTFAAPLMVPSSMMLPPPAATNNNNNYINTASTNNNNTDNHINHNNHNHHAHMPPVPLVLPPPANMHMNMMLPIHYTTNINANTNTNMNTANSCYNHNYDNNNNNNNNQYSNYASNNSINNTYYVSQPPPYNSQPVFVRQ